MARYGRNSGMRTVCQLLAAVAGGLFKDVFAACEAMNSLNGKKQDYSEDSNAKYEKIYPVYKKLYGAVKGIYM